MTLPALKLHRLIAPLIAAIALMSCSHTPDGIVSRKVMTDILYDMYRSEAVMEYERSLYYSDSLKLLLRHAIYQRHGVTPAQVDTSFYWYGHHIDQFIEMHDEVIRRLQDDLKQQTGRSVVYAEGDSIDLWPGLPAYRFSGDRMVTTLQYSVPLDNDAKDGDNYTLQFHQSDPELAEATIAMFANYDDQTVEFRIIHSSSTNPWNRIILPTDSTKALTRLYGYISYQLLSPTLPAYIDSVSLVRTRLNPATYSQRYSLRRLSTKLSSQL